MNKHTPVIAVNADIDRLIGRLEQIKAMHRVGSYLDQRAAADQAKEMIAEAMKEMAESLRQFASVPPLSYDDRMNIRDALMDWWTDAVFEADEKMNESTDEEEREADYERQREFDHHNALRANL